MSDDDFALLVMRLVRAERERNRHPLERRMRDARDPWSGVSLTRRDLLSDTTAIALDYDFPTERRNTKGELDNEGSVAIVDLTSLHPRGERPVSPSTSITIFVEATPRLSERLKIVRNEGVRSPRSKSPI